MKPSCWLLLLSSLYSLSAAAFEPFLVKDIRVEGIQRTEPGTVFSYLPVKIGDTLTEEGAAEAIKALFATGFFKDVRLEAEGNVLVVSVVERPAIAQIDFVGQKEFDKDKLREALKHIGLAQGRIFDRSLLEKAEQELKTQYLSRGMYAVEITTTVTPLERNRVAINFNIAEGDVAKIHQINIVGNKVFSESELLDQFTLTTPGLLTWYSKNDQYSKQKLEGDLESLRSYYLNQGYLEFTIDSTQVSISPDRKDVFLVVNITEGDKFNVSDVKLAGELLLPEAELRKLIKLKKGDVFSREKLTESTKLIVDRLGNEGYAFANVNPVPDIDREKKEVAFTLYVDPGRRVYVRRINISGNTTTRDEVIRREMRQMEGGWYSAEKLKRSKQRIDKLGYFSEVSVDTINVPGTNDQVDIEVKVVERPTGNLLFGIGFSTAEKVILSASVSQSNLFGTGNALSLQINSGSVNKVYALSYTNPYFTDDGVSLGVDLYKRNVDAANLNSVTPYKTATLGAGLRFGVPVTEYDTISYGLAVERTNVETFPGSPPQYLEFVDQFGNTNTALIGTVGWARDGRDSVIYTTSGLLQRLNFEVAVPPAELRYYRATYRVDYWYPVSRNNVLQVSGQIGYANGYDDKPLPFYKNFYLGGIGSVRGYYTSSIGPKDPLGNALGGSTLTAGSLEFYFPFPGLEKDKSVRLSTFVDAGQVSDNFDFSQTRIGVGLALSWYSPVGPIKISFARAIFRQPEDRVQPFQFSLGTTF
ncbi:MAG TPA: outer membrane protein assembly factor BamA [Burkholderiales bacterium]|nr:outer membrane protein assembly factor BamA [Burkholderiales bacterium]